MHAPELRAIGHVHELGGDDEQLAVVNTWPVSTAWTWRCDRRSPRRTLALEAEDGAAGDHPQPGQARQTVDQALGEAVAEIVRSGSTGR